MKKLSVQSYSEIRPSQFDQKMIAPYDRGLIAIMIGNEYSDRMIFFRNEFILTIRVQ